MFLLQSIKVVLLMFEPTDTNIPKTPFSSSQPPERKQVPPSKEVRCLIRDRVEALVAGLDRRVPIDKYALEVHARVVLEQLELADAYLGWTMVMIGSAFWKEQVAATPLSRRLLLLPHCLRDIESCPARFNEFGLMCKDCGACRLSALRARAEKLGYQVLIAEGSPVVMQILIGGHADAMLGVSCLDVLEKSLEKILLAGIPCMAVPLIKAGCQNTETDDDWVLEMIEIPYRPTGHKTQTYVHLLRCAKRIFQPEEFDWLVPRDRQPELAAKEAAPGLDPLAATESIAYDFALRGGKRARPFVTLAVYDAMTGGGATGGSDGAERAAAIPDHVKRVAVAIEIFHKASLVHDDLEDDDPIRYGRPTLHCQYSTATAINVGDYLIGLGYRVVAGQCGRAGAEAVVDILAQLAESHTRLCEGQGAELAWREADDKRLTPLDALKIYALKTAPAFEAALYAGVRLAGPVEAYGQTDPSVRAVPGRRVSDSQRLEELALVVGSFSRNRDAGRVGHRRLSSNGPLGLGAGVGFRRRTARTRDSSYSAIGPFRKGFSTDRRSLSPGECRVAGRSVGFKNITSGPVWWPTKSNRPH